jgi:hypothetical protein
MPGMNSGLSSTNPTLVAAFRTALEHQGLVVIALLLVFALIAVGVPEALAASGGRLSVWQLAPVPGAGSSGSAARHWKLAQTVKVSIPYGSPG